MCVEGMAAQKEKSNIGRSPVWRAKVARGRCKHRTASFATDALCFAASTQLQRFAHLAFPTVTAVWTGSCVSSSTRTTTADGVRSKHKGEQGVTVEEEAAAMSTGVAVRQAPSATAVASEQDNKAPMATQPPPPSASLNAIRPSILAADVGVLAIDLEATLKALLVQVGIALRARVRLQSSLDAVRAKQQSAQAEEREAKLTDDELMFLQQFGQHNGSGAVDVRIAIPNYKALERECIRYRALTRLLSHIIQQAKDVLQVQLPIALEREEKEREQQRIKEEQEAERRQQRQAEEQQQQEQQKESPAQPSAQAAHHSEADTKVDGARPDAINLDDDDDDDDLPLAGRPTAAPRHTETDGAKPAEARSSDAIDLTEESPTVKFTPLPSVSGPDGVTARATDPATLLAQLGAAVSGASSAPTGTDATTSAGGFSAPIATSQPMALDNFDFSSLGMNNSLGDLGISSGGTGLDEMAGADGMDDSLLNFNADQFDGVDLSFLNNLGGSGDGGGADASSSDNNLLGSIDFSGLLGNNDPSSSG